MSGSARTRAISEVSHVDLLSVPVASGKTIAFNMGGSRNGMNFESKLKGMPVLESRTGNKIGLVSDLIVDPSEGKALGLTILRPDKQTCTITPDKFRLGKDAVMAIDDACLARGFPREFVDGASVSRMLGEHMVTEDGHLVGRLRDVHVTPDSLTINYHVIESAVQRWIGGGFYISGVTPQAFSADLKRIIVPSEVKEHARKTLDELRKSA
jgi:sporulation protein YlmC with PRC-barrel domain